MVSGFHRDVDESFALSGGYEQFTFLSTQKYAEFNYMQIVQFALCGELVYWLDLIRVCCSQRTCELYFTTAPLRWLISLLHVLWLVSGFHLDKDDSEGFKGGYEPLPFVSTQKGAELNHKRIVGIALCGGLALEEALE